MTIEEFLTELVYQSLPNFNIETGEGLSFQDWLISTSIEKPSCFISYEGFTEVDIYNNGTGAKDDENYSLFLRCDEPVKPYAKLLKDKLMDNFSEFTDENDVVRFVSMQRGNPFRDNGATAFEISIIIK